MNQNLFSRRRQTKRKQKQKRHHNNDFLDSVQETTQDRTLDILSLSHEGRGIAKFNGKTQFVDGALPGETVIAKILSCHTSYDELQAVEILKPADDRIEPFCPHFEQCGGCSLQYLDSASQLAHKESVLREQLSHFGQLDLNPTGQLNVGHWLDPIRSERQAYRSKARLGVYFDSSRNSLIIGFREKRSKSLTPISQCPVLQHDIARLVPLLPELVAALDDPHSVSHIELAAGDSQAAIVIRHQKAFTSRDMYALETFSKEQAVAIFSQGEGDQSAVNLFGSRSTLNYSLAAGDAQKHIHLEFHPQDFTQVNSRVNQAMVNKALEELALSDHERALDLFCGLGNFTLPMALQCAEVTGIEGVKALVQRATENAQQNDIHNVSFYKADLFSDFRSAAWANRTYDKILIDPPRAGALAVVNYLQYFNATRIVYISCNPATLARDAGILAKHGYRLEKAGVMDMFPNTAHVESIAVFVR